jgi:spermidine/putrescine transport system substrate-binding protein
MKRLSSQGPVKQLAIRYQPTLRDFACGRGQPSVETLGHFRVSLRDGKRSLAPIVPRGLRISTFRFIARHFFVVLVALFAGCGRPQPQLNLFIWSEYIDPKIIAGFEERFGCQVNLDYYEDPDGMIAKLAAGGTSTYDIIAPSDNTLPILVKRGMVAPLRHENIPNLKNIDPQFSNQAYDPGNQYSAPLDWGTTGIYLRKPKDKPVEATWGLIFDPAKQPGPFLLIEDVRACIGAALRYKGYSVNSTNSEELAEARDLLIDAKRRSLGFEGGTGCKNRVLSKGAVLAMTYNGDAVRGIKEDPETAYVLPREGSQIYVDVLSIPAKAPHRDLAEKFINYLLEPEVGAQFGNFARLATPNKAALKFIDPTDLKNPAIYPPPEAMSRLEYAIDLGELNKRFDELWMQIKAK